MKIEHLAIDYSEIKQKLVPRLRERVFHMTCRRYAENILQAGEVSANADGELPSAFGSSSNSFFRLRGCVSVFDYRNIPEDLFQDALSKCGPHRASQVCNHELTVFFLSEEASRQLQSWHLWKESESFSQMIVPDVEAGYPGPIPITAIQEVLHVSLAYKPSAFELAVAASHAKSDDPTD